MLAQKLDLLMKVTNTKNSTLGRALAFDPSYIGRIRSGKRGLPKNQPFAQPAAAFFVRNMPQDYQKEAIAAAVCPGQPWPDNQAEAEKLLAVWLSQNDAKANASVQTILSKLNSTVDSGDTESKLGLTGVVKSPESYYYGNSGKRAAVQTFLETLCHRDEPSVLKLYSDEDMSWLYENDAYAKNWAALLVALIKKGSRIQIIHTISRDIGEMLEAIEKWLPLYASGAIEPYFYPRLRDNVFHRTLFIAQKHSAVIASSIGSNTTQSLNIYLTDQAAVRALETEYQNYLALCRPLMSIYNGGNGNELVQLLQNLKQTNGDLLSVGLSLSFLSLPQTVAASMAKRTARSQLLVWQAENEQWFNQSLRQGNKVTEFIRLPSWEQVENSEVMILYPWLDLAPLRYSSDEFVRHLENVIKLLSENEGYNVVLNGPDIGDMTLLVKENDGVLMSKAQLPSTVFGIMEPRLTVALSEYLWRNTDKVITKENIIKQLKTYLTQKPV